jgi:hypothetical protein
MYELDQNNPKDYVSEFIQKVKTHRFNGPHNGLIDDKLNLSLLMDHCDVPHPRILAIVRWGEIYPFDASRAADAQSWLHDQMSRDGCLVLKPLRGFKGKGFAALSKKGDDYLINGIKASLSDLETLILSVNDCYISTFISQAEYAHQIYPDTTNTVRILTYWDYVRQEPFIATAVHRFGTERSYPVDNWKSGLGGLSAKIDLDTGELGPAVNLDPEGKLQWHDAHPETGVHIQGVRLPRWAGLTEMIQRAAGALPFIPDIAWDCVITDAGCCVLELNGASALFVVQIHEPLLRDPRVRAFYKHHGIA